MSKIKIKKFYYPLLNNAISDSDIQKGIEVLKSKQLTMSKITRKFEKEFASYIGSKFAVMVNSGSSANLLSVFASCNPLRNKRFKRDDEAIIPSICWSTSLWPLVQAGLKPVFADINKETLNIDIDSLESKITKKTKVLMMVHVLGLSTEMDKVRKLVKKYNLILIEDTCESLGTMYKNKFLGSFGDFGTYSFYYSHQITAGEGGMVVCNNREDYNLLMSLRSHGWSRGLKMNLSKYKKYKGVDKKFMFINSGFNLRPTEIQAAIGFNQFKRKNIFKHNRSKNREKIIKAFKKNSEWSNQFIFIKENKNTKPSWFGMPILLNEEYKKKKKKFLESLDRIGIETRPIISGNFINQPSVDLYKLNEKKDKFPNAQYVDDCGFFIGLQTEIVSDLKIKKLVSIMLKTLET